MANGPVFILTGPGKSIKKKQISLNEDGTFDQKVTPGTYKFSIKISGWDDAEGTIIVSDKAKRKARIFITLRLS